MNIAKLVIIAEECCANIQAGQVVAFQSLNDTEWHDPWGGTFDAVEQSSLNDLARGDEVSVRLSSVNGRPRVFGARLAVKF